MKVLHCSDIHLGKRPFGNENFSKKRYEDYFEAFGQVVEVAVKEKVEVVIIAGDLFDKKDLSPDILARTEVLFEKLKSKKIKVLITEGNHDNSNRYDVVNSWLQYLEERELSKRLSYTREKGVYEFQKEKIGDINFYGLGFPGFNVDNVVESLSEKLNPEEKNIVLIHTAIGGEKTALPGLVKTEFLNLLKGKAIYVAGGHLHSKKIYPSEQRAESKGEKPFFFVPGSTEYWNVINERANEKGVFIFDTETEKYDYIEVNPRKRIKEVFSVKEVSDSGESFKEWTKTLELTGEELVVVEVEIEENIYVNTKDMEEVLEKAGALKAYVVPIFRTSCEREERGFSTGNHTTSEIENEIISRWEGFGNSKLAENFELLKGYQKDGKEYFEQFHETLDEILEEMIGGEYENK